MRLYGRWKVSLPGEEHVWEPDEVLFSEQLLLENESGMSYDEWILDGVRLSRAVPCQILVWFLRRKADPAYQVDRMAIEFPIRKLDLERLDIEDEVDPDPEAPAASEAATPLSSPASTESAPGSSNGSPVPILS